MPVSKSNGSNRVVASEVGFAEGPGNGTQNTALLQTLLDQEKTVHFPSGTWEFSGSILVFDKNGGGVTGDGESTVLNINTRSRFFSIKKCENFVFRGLNLRGLNWVTGPAASNLQNWEPFFIWDRTKNLTIEDCIISGFSTYRAAILAEASSVLKFVNNTLYYNHASDRYGWDIQIRSALIGGTVQTPCRDVMIQGNRCYSNNNGGIGCVSAADNYTITDNHVITCDENLEELKDEINNAGCIRKEGITVVYNVTTTDNDLHTEFTCVVANNLIRNTRWSGIYCNLNSTGDASNRESGVSGVISGNRIHNVCFEDSKQDDVKQNGICIEQAQQVVISDNVVTNVRGVFYDPYTSDFPNAAIHISSPWIRSSVAEGYTTESSILVSNNIVDTVK